MSKKMKTILIVVALLAGIGVFNYVMQMDPTQLAARGVGQDPHSHDDESNDHEHEGQPEGPTIEDLQEPIGPEDAPVDITVLWEDRLELERMLRPMLGAIASSYEDKVRVEFVGREDEEYARLVEEATSGVGTALLINGEMIKEVPEADLGMLAFSGPPSLAPWGEKEVRLAVEHELEDAGVEFEAHVEHDHGDQEGHGRAMPQRRPMGGHEGHDHAMPGGHEGHGH
jgi:hypothetical protein